MGSDSDLPVLKNTINTLKGFGIEVETHIMSAHRTPAQACEFSSKARENGFGVIIAAEMCIRDRPRPSKRFSAAMRRPKSQYGTAPIYSYKEAGIQYSLILPHTAL